MEIREATTNDGPAIRSIALWSLQTSYWIDVQTIKSAVMQWYGIDSFVDRLEDDAELLLVVELDGQPVAFSDSVLVDDRGDISWLHVAGNHRGEGIGRKLYEATREHLKANGAETIRGLVLGINTDGNRFYKHCGLKKVSERTVQVGDREFTENIYLDEDREEPEPILVEGDELYIDRADSERGSKASFYVVYEDTDLETPYSYYCGNCESLIMSMDPAGQLLCEGCDNHVEPTRWDAAYV